jgi:hypothetical protein
MAQIAFTGDFDVWIPFDYPERTRTRARKVPFAQFRLDYNCIKLCVYDGILGARINTEPSCFTPL